MGVWLKARNVKWGDEHERMALEIHEMAWPYCANPDGSFNRSKTTRWAIEMWHLALSTPGILEKLGLLLQGLQCARYVSTQQVPGEVGPAKPGVMRMAQSGHEGNRTRRTGTTNGPTYRLATVGAVGSCPVGQGQKDRCAWAITSLPSQVRFAGMVPRRRAA